MSSYFDQQREVLFHALQRHATANGGENILSRGYEHAIINLWNSESMST